MVRSPLVAATLVSLALFALPAEAQLVTNGGFETGSLLGWTLTGTSCSTGVLSTVAHTGTYGLRSGPVAGTCELAQTFATTPGEQYTFAFWVQNLSGSTPNSFDARWDGVSLYSTSNAPLLGYTEHSLVVTATSPASTISFVVRHDAAWHTLDDVRVASVSTVPEPSTYALMAAGLLGIMMARRRRRA